MTKSVSSVSERLQSARDAKGLSLSEVAQETCISICYLKAIEAGKYDELPAQTFTIGFIKSYAQALGLDCAELVAQYKSEAEPDQPAETAAVETETLSGFVSMKPPRKKSWLAPSLAALGIAGVWSFMGMNVSVQTMVAQNDYDNQPAQAVQFAEGVQNTNLAPEQFASKAVEASLSDVGTSMLDAVPTQTLADSDVASAASHTDVAAARVAYQDEQASGALRHQEVRESQQSLFTSPVYADPVDADDATNDVTIVATDDSWVRLERADGSEVWSGVLRAGERFNPKLEQGVLFTTSNAGAVRFAIGDDETAPLGEIGEIIAATSLDDLRSHNLGE
jgi:cytoskeleton protein RodZ